MHFRLTLIIYTFFFSTFIYAHEWDQFIGCYEGVENSKVKMSVSFSEKDSFWSSAEEEGAALKSFSIWTSGIENGVTVSSVFADNRYSKFFRNLENENEFHYDFSGKAVFLGNSTWIFSKHSAFIKHENDYISFENHTYLFQNDYSEVYRFSNNIIFKKLSSIPCNPVMNVNKVRRM